MPDSNLAGSVGLFSKLPMPGQAKTRLIPELGAQGAADLAKWLLFRMLNTLCLGGVSDCVLWRTGGNDEQWQSLLEPWLMTHADRVVSVWDLQDLTPIETDKPGTRELLIEADQRGPRESLNLDRFTDPNAQDQVEQNLAKVRLHLKWQAEGSLGRRMRVALNEQIGTFGGIASLVGTDAICLELPHIRELHQRADELGMAFIPASDGGYVAVAASRVEPRVFEDDLPWGGPSVMRETLRRLDGIARTDGREATPRCLAVQPDLDEAEDYRKALSEAWLPTSWRSERFD